ncbi:DNA-processing protein DprA [Lachnoclostridium sp. Marseille-P6806]|uniref:DNA-processing protein DprA n=1 Tax=Lachnoclostridium sp. Marseille-P6806 TaxID=2364793 RepID=UPI0013EF58B0|nr:DNA-processing protein DprA [Lachnoclostridium sp. Marseille-P6806]
MNRYACWLYSIPGIGRIRIHALRRAFLRCYRADPRLFPSSVFRMSEKELRALCQNGAEEGEEGARDRETLQRACPYFLAGRQREPEQAVSACRRAGLFFVSYDDPGFPERLKRIPEPPYALYFRGSLPEEQRPSAGVVGARLCSAYGREQARRFSAALAENGIQIVSGMARGVDGIAQRAAMDAGGRSFAVLGCGADICYPAENGALYERLRAEGGIISEYPPGTRAEPGLFPVRNRLIAGFSDLVLLVEARERSGSLITCARALEQGKEVYAVPGRVCDALSVGPNRLIRDGAGIATQAEDVIEVLLGIRGDAGAGERNPEVEEEKALSLPEPEASLYRVLEEREPCGLSEMLQGAGESLRRELRAEEAMGCMIRLELKGLVEEAGVGQYIRRRS